MYVVLFGPQNLQYWILGYPLRCTLQVVLLDVFLLSLLLHHGFLVTLLKVQVSSALDSHLDILRCKASSLTLLYGK